MTPHTTTLSHATLIVCAIVRDCAGNLKRNIPTITQLCRSAKAYHIVIFENDSIDRTKQILQQWADADPHVHISLNTFGTTTIPPRNSPVNPTFSVARNAKMASYRNHYLDYIEHENLPGDYVIVLDPDVRKIHLDGLLKAFDLPHKWDALTANGSSRAISSLFRRRYYDTYALIERGCENIPQTEQSIRAAQYRWAFLRPHMPLIPVASAFGGLAIYRREAIASCRYGVLINNDEKVESRAEHVFFHQQMNACGHNRIFINPAMRLQYQTQVINTLRKIWNRNKPHRIQHDKKTGKQSQHNIFRKVKKRESSDNFDFTLFAYICALKHIKLFINKL